MRGASALNHLLAEFPDADIQVQAVWEPVLRTDLAAPLSGVLALLKDRRVLQYWDPDLRLSGDLVRAANRDPARYRLDEPFPPDFVAWDLVAVFGKTARWDADLPVPVSYGGPVVDWIEETRKALSAELERGSLKPGRSAAPSRGALSRPPPSEFRPAARRASCS